MFREAEAAPAPAGAGARQEGQDQESQGAGGGPGLEKHRDLEHGTSRCRYLHVDAEEEEVLGGVVRAMSDVFRELRELIAEGL
eukprot:750203-Hanusia_phi.AAC.5